MAKRATAAQKADSGHLIGYARVSTAEQSLQLQIDALLRADVHPDHIYTEKVSGAAARRPGLEAAILDCNRGDTLVVWKLDRVGRSLKDLLARFEQLEEAGIGFRSLTETVDTTTPFGKLYVHFLGALAQFERDLIRERTKAGMRSAKDRGVKVGRKAAIAPSQYAELLRMRDGKKTVDAIARHFGVSRQTVYTTVTKAKAAKRRK